MAINRPEYRESQEVGAVDGTRMFNKRALLAVLAVAFGSIEAQGCLDVRQEDEQSADVIGGDTTIDAIAGDTGIAIDTNNGLDSVSDDTTVADTSTPVDTVTPEDTVQPADTFVPADTVTPEDTYQPADTFVPVDTVTPEDTYQPADTFVPVDTVTPEDTVQPADTVGPVDTIVTDTLDPEAVCATIKIQTNGVGSYETENSQFPSLINGLPGSVDFGLQCKDIDGQGANDVLRFNIKGTQVKISEPYADLTPVVLECRRFTSSGDSLGASITVGYGQELVENTGSEITYKCDIQD